MCGIAGIVYRNRERPVERGALVRMRDALRHRGPDDDGIVAEPGWGFAHTRLSVLDLSRRARQPMDSPSGRYCLTYNGEIYNFRELRAELEREGARFLTGSDTEVIVQLADRGGPEALAALQGMFALGLYDRERGELLLVRDRLGIKPLFWARADESVCFASEPKALPAWVRQASPTPERVAEYLAFRHVAGAECLLPAVETLAPGAWLRTDGETIRSGSWWAEPTASAGGTRDDADLQQTLDRAVARQTVSDVPVGVFLSGGVDSALVTDAVHRAAGALDTFTVGFDEPAWDETDRAAHVAHTVGVPQHVLRLDEARYVRDLPRTVWHLDAPLNHAHSVHVLELSRFARERITVALTGEGGDEVFAGYPRYRIFHLAQRLRGMGTSPLARAALASGFGSPRLRRLLTAVATDDAGAAAANPAFVPVEDAVRLAGLSDPGRLLDERRRLYQDARARGSDPIHALLSLERRTYLVSLLQRMDRLGMATGLECRVPLLDESVVDYADHLPGKDLLDLRETKKPTRRLAASRFGREFAYAPKSGFGVPVGEWLRNDGPFATLARTVLEDPRTKARGWTDAEHACQLLREHRTGPADHTEILWGALNLELWARICVDGDGITEFAR